MSAATQIATKDLRLRVRDRSFFILGVIAPLSLAVILNFVFGDTFTDSSFDLEYGLVDQDQSEEGASEHGRRRSASHPGQ